MEKKETELLDRIRKGEGLSPLEKTEESQKDSSESENKSLSPSGIRWETFSAKTKTDDEL